MNEREKAKATSSGPTGDASPTAGEGEIGVKKGVVDDGEGKLNPSAPGETGTTPGTNNK